MSQDLKATIEKRLKVFTNLLKEFPKNESDDFIYDDSTLAKIASVRAELHELSRLLDRNPAGSSDGENETAGAMLEKIFMLMEELPADPEDEFLYDKSIHRLVQEARAAVKKLGDHFSG